MFLASTLIFCNGVPIKILTKISLHIVYGLMYYVYYVVNCNVDYVDTLKRSVEIEGRRYIT